MKQEQSEMELSSKMRILVAYMSQTGNTKKVAEAIFNSVPQQKEIKHIGEVQSLDGYNLIFLGFPVHNFGPDEQSANFLKLYTKNQNLALFITHAAPEGGAVVDDWVQKFADAAKEANICGLFDCQGELSQQVKNVMLNHCSVEIRRWAKADNSKGKPDEIQLERARVFAADTIKNFTLLAGATDLRQDANQITL
jgi:flavodoxin